jgi:uncharacterized heparinase superfamily protein
MEQVAYQFYYRLAKPLVHRRALLPVGNVSQRPWRSPWAAPLVLPRCHFAFGKFEFLGESGQVRSPADWNTGEKSKLWLYNLHYLDDLNAADADQRAEQQEWLIERWIKDNPPLAGNGWEPYPLSLRLVNLVKWFARQPRVPAQWLDSMARQAQALAAQEERHIQANHLFANGKALTFAGAFLAVTPGIGIGWLERGLRILDREVKAQFLHDGGHFERSPMYHASLLWDLCDLVNLAKRSGLAPLTERADDWRAVIERGLVWLTHMCHPDGDISFFNDAALGIAPRLEQIQVYAAALGCGVGNVPADHLSCAFLVDTGYIAVPIEQDGKALLDVAEVGPEYQPGHAHADTLSFELSLFGQRVLVNSGTSRYGEDCERQRQRGTAAHNTVEIDGENSSEVWAGFRVARRARPGIPEIWHGRVVPGERLVVRCTHDGYRRLRGAPVHQRQWEFAGDSLRVTDSLSGRFRRAVSRFYLHPDVQVAGDQELHLKGDHKLRWCVSGGQAKLVSSTWHPGFGVSLPSHCIEIPFESSELTVDFFWA